MLMVNWDCWNTAVISGRCPQDFDCQDSDCNEPKYLDSKTSSHTDPKSLNTETVYLLKLLGQTV